MLKHTSARRFPFACRRGARGFTLVEVVVAFVLLGILMVLGLPSFTAMIANSQVRLGADALQNGVRLAQTEAVRRNRQVVMTLTNAQPALNAAAVANGKNWSIQTVAQFGETPEFVKGGALTDVASTVAVSGPASICFNSNGRLVANTAPGVPGATCAASAATFNLSRANSDRPLRVIVALGGRVHMCDPNRPAQSNASPDGCP